MAVGNKCFGQSGDSGKSGNEIKNSAQQGERASWRELVVIKEDYIKRKFHVTIARNSDCPPRSLGYLQTETDGRSNHGD